MSKLAAFITTALLAAGITTLAQPDALADGPVSEQRFLQATRGAPMYVRPNGRYTTEAQMLAFGYQACAKLDQHPRDTMAAARALYPGVPIDFERQRIVLSSALYLCERHAHRFENF